MTYYKPPILHQYEDVHYYSKTQLMQILFIIHIQREMIIQKKVLIFFL